MNTPKSSITPYIIIAVIVAGALGGYFYWSGTQTPDSTTLGQTDSSQVVGAQVFQLLGQINQLSIDSKFFESDAFQSLQDYSVIVPSVPVGRPNPFAPLPGSAIQATTTTILKIMATTTAKKH